MSTNDNETGSHRTSRWRRFGIYAAILIAVFLLGFVPMWLRARNRAAERDTAQRALRLSKMENDLAAGVINARRGEYEPARQAASGFFTSPRIQCDNSAELADFTVAQCNSTRPLLDQRDNLITLLARSDPAAADRLTESYVLYKKAMGVSQ